MSIVAMLFWIMKRRLRTSKPLILVVSESATQFTELEIALRLLITRKSASCYVVSDEPLISPSSACLPPCRLSLSLSPDRRSSSDHLFSSDRLSSNHPAPNCQHISSSLQMRVVRYC
jgi:hypothetical protein